jgi:hypothetical protein
MEGKAQPCLGMPTQYLRRDGENCTCETCRSYHAGRQECHWSWPNTMNTAPRPWQKVELDDFCNSWYGKEAQMHARPAQKPKPFAPGSHHKRPPMTWPECMQVLKEICIGLPQAKTFLTLHQHIRKERRLKVSEFRALLEVGEVCGGLKRDGERYYLNDKVFWSGELVEYIREKDRPVTPEEIEKLIAETYPNGIGPEGETDSAVDHAVEAGLIEWADNFSTVRLTEKGKAKGPPSPAEDLEIE